MWDLGGKRLRATTVAIADPGPLNRFLPKGGDGTAFLRHGQGIVTIGEVARFETDYVSAGDVWWQEVASQIDHDSELPGQFGTGPIAVGSFAFDPDRSEERSRLIVPEIIIGRRGDQSWLTRIGAASSDITLPERGESLAATGEMQLSPGAMSERVWTDIVAEVIALIQSNEVSKVVLARDLIVKSDEPIDARTLLHRLARHYPTCWSYLVDGLVGATPELLIRREGALATSRVLAGTVSLDPATDPMTGAAALARSAKDVAEHEFAVTSVAEALAPFCSAMNVPEAPSVLPLPNVLHLATDITGVCEPDATALTLAAALHPSAAVCSTQRSRRAMSSVNWNR